MFVEKIDELDTSKNTNDYAVVCSRYELEQLKYIMDDFIRSHGILQTPYAADCSNSIADCLK